MSSNPHVMLRALLVASMFVLSAGVGGCGRGVWTHIHTWMDETRKQSKPEDVRAALAPLFSYEGKHDHEAHVIWITNEVPKQIQSLPIFCAAPTNIEVECSEDRNELDLTIGSGFGHWGIVVLRPGYNEDLSGRSGYIPWGDGVYFYDEYK